MPYYQRPQRPDAPNKFQGGYNFAVVVTVGIGNTNIKWHQLKVRKRVSVCVLLFAPMKRLKTKMNDIGLKFQIKQFVVKRLGFSVAQ